MNWTLHDLLTAAVTLVAIAAWCTVCVLVAAG